eukprot:3932171-Rhodomonas_salina.1
MLPIPLMLRPFHGVLRSFQGMMSPSPYAPRPVQGIDHTHTHLGCVAQTHPEQQRGHKEPRPPLPSLPTQHAPSGPRFTSRSHTQTERTSPGSALPPRSSLLRAANKVTHRFPQKQPRVGVVKRTCIEEGGGGVAEVDERLAAQDTRSAPDTGRPHRNSGSGWTWKAGALWSRIGDFWTWAPHRGISVRTRSEAGQKQAEKERGR